MQWSVICWRMLSFRIISHTASELTVSGVQLSQQSAQIATDWTLDVLRRERVRTTLLFFGKNGPVEQPSLHGRKSQQGEGSILVG